MKSCTVELLKAVVRHGGLLWGQGVWNVKSA